MTQTVRGITPTITIRDATAADMPVIQSIYATQVLHGLATFEEEPPTAEDLLSRRDAILRRGLPYLCAERNGQVIGYSYAAAHRPRPAYRYTVEDSVYVDESAQGQGVGRGLLEAVIARCEAGPWRQMTAVIGDTANTGSIALHARLGFRHVGTLEAVGFKLGRWVDTVIMQRPLGPGGSIGPEHYSTDPGP